MTERLLGNRSPQADSRLLELRDVRRYFALQRTLPWNRSGRRVKAVDGVTIVIDEHETLGLVGESGCGKSTTAKLVLGLETPDSGTILFRGTDLRRDRRARRAARGAVQAVLQNPWSSLNPRMRIADSIAEPMVALGERPSRIRERVESLMVDVGLETSTSRSYPHEFSGGQRQRVAIARAISVNPDLVVLDEPVSAVDVSVRAQIMNLLRDLQEVMGLSYLLISHDLATVRYLSHHVAVMYLGQIVEQAPTDEIFQAPAHPYTVGLIDAAKPAGRSSGERPVIISGDVPSSEVLPTGCRFHPRCWLYEKLGNPEICSRVEPALQPVTPLGGQAEREVRCHFSDEVLRQTSEKVTTQ